MNAVVRINRPSILANTVFDGFLNNLIQDFPSHLKQSTQGYPVADIYSNEDGSTIMEFALAGFKREEISVDVKPDTRSITVSADPGGQDGDAQRRIARRSFTKTYVNYDNNLDLSASTAEFNNGLLRLVIPKRPEVKPLSIKIK